MDPCQHVTKKCMASSTSDNPKCAEWQVMQPINACFWNLLNTMRASIPDYQTRYTNLAFRRDVQERTFRLHQKLGSPGKLQAVSVLSQGSRLVSLAEQDCRNTRLQHLRTPRRYGKGGGAHSVPRSGVEKRSFAHTVLLLGAFPFTSQ